MNVTIIEDEVKKVPEIKAADDDFVIENGILTACNNRKLENAVIPEGVSYIGEGAFMGMTSLKEVVLPEGLKTICDSAFSSCTNLKAINLPASLTKLQSAVFYNSCLGQITLPPSLTMIGDHCFELTPIGSIDIPDSVEYIGKCAFKQTALKTVAIPALVKTLGAEAFSKCVLLEELIIEGSDIEIPESFCEGDCKLKAIDLSNVRSIGSRAFYRCEKLRISTIPANVECINFNAFGQVKNVKDLVIEDLKAFHYATSVFAESSVESVQINIKDDESQIIPSEMFFKCQKLQNVTFVGNTENITEIGKYAFAETKIESFDIPKGVTKIHSYAFCSCKKLQKITLPNGLKTIGTSAFANCGLTEVIIPDRVEQIDDACFQSCVNLTHVQLSKKVSTISEYCFHNCRSLESFETAGKIMKINAFAFCDCAIKYFDFSSVVTIGQGAFKHSAIENIVFSEYLLINNNSSYSNSADNAFEDCVNLVLVDFSRCKNVTRIAHSMFKRCQNLKQVILNKDIVFFGSFCFFGTSIESITFPKDISWIDNNSFGNLSLRSVTFEKGTNPDVVISLDAFHDTTIENLTIPNALYKKYEASIWKWIK